METYQYGHQALTGSDASVLLPQVDVCEAGPTWPHPRGWQRPSATVSISACSVEGNMDP